MLSLPSGRGRWQGWHSRPLAEVPVQGQPARLGGDLKRQLGAPGRSWEHAEEAVQLHRREAAVVVLQAERLWGRVPGGWRGRGGGARRESRHPHLIVLLKHPLHKLVAEVVELGAAAWGHVEPVGVAGALWFPGSPVPTTLPTPPVSRDGEAPASPPRQTRVRPRVPPSLPPRGGGGLRSPPGTGLTRRREGEPSAPPSTHGGAR